MAPTALFRSQATRRPSTSEAFTAPPQNSTLQRAGGDECRSKRGWCGPSNTTSNIASTIGDPFRMQDEDFELLYQLEESYWWFPAMRQITDVIAGRELQQSNLKILDAGCGTGFNLGYYGATGHRDVYGLDISDTALKHVGKRGFRKIARASITEIPFKSDSFDLVFSFEVVTQTPYETHDASLTEMYRVLKPGGHLFIRVPAFMWLWSSHDEELEVRYRYQREELG